MSIWTYKNSILSSRSYLEDKKISYEEICHSIMNDMQIVSIKVCNANDDAILKMHECKRYDLKLKVSCKTCDSFFNGITGYRAQFYESIPRGVWANAYILNLLKSKLMNAGVGEYSDIEKYYKLSSTKIWIEEEDEYKNYIYDDPIVEIEASRWVEVLKGPNLLSRRGVRAYFPASCCLEIKTGFLSNENVEMISSNKIYRAEEIHKYGAT